MFANSAAPAAHPQPIVQISYVGELICHLCGRTAGIVQSEQQPLPATVRFTALGSDHSVTVLNWRRLRCAHCGGSLLLDDLEEIRRRVEPVNAFEEERPRRGRPPKWLVEQRRRERELLEQQAEAEREAQAA